MARDREYTVQNDNKECQLHGIIFAASSWDDSPGIIRIVVSEFMIFAKENEEINVFFTVEYTDFHLRMKSLLAYQISDHR